MKDPGEWLQGNPWSITIAQKAQPCAPKHSTTSDPDQLSKGEGGMLEDYINWAIPGLCLTEWNEKLDILFWGAKGTTSPVLVLEGAGIKKFRKHDTGQA